MWFSRGRDAPFVDGLPCAAPRPRQDVHNRRSSHAVIRGGKLNLETNRRAAAECGIFFGDDGIKQSPHDNSLALPSAELPPYPATDNRAVSFETRPPIERELARKRREKNRTIGGRFHARRLDLP